MRTPIIAANWKMNKGPADTAAFLDAFLPKLDPAPACEVVVAAPFVSLAAAAVKMNGTHAALSAQNMYFEDNGAFTGEVSPGMLQELGCDFAIIGHSERRAIFGEDNALLNKKVLKAHEVGLKPIFCIGETLEERDGGQLESVIKSQIEEGLAGVDAARMPETVVAYEPVWAIGTGRTASPEQAQEAHAFVRSVLAGVFGDDVAQQVRIQYGGSVKPGNAAELLGQPDIDGALVGGASLEADSFYGIVEAA